MNPFSYTGLKIVHDQEIQEALKRHHLYAGQETQRQSLFQTFAKFLARFNYQSRRKQERPLPDCVCEQAGC